MKSACSNRHSPRTLIWASPLPHARFTVFKVVITKFWCTCYVATEYYSRVPSVKFSSVYSSLTPSKSQVLFTDIFSVSAGWGPDMPILKATSGLRNTGLLMDTTDKLWASLGTKMNEEPLRLPVIETTAPGRKATDKF